MNKTIRSFDKSVYTDNKRNIIGIIGAITDITEQKKSELQKDKLISELQRAMENVKQLKGLLPICSYCKKIRDDQGYWNQIVS